MDLGQPTTMSEVQAFIVIVQYYRDMCTSWYHTLDPLIKATSGPKGWKIPWNDAKADYFKDLNHMVSAETLLSCPYLKIPFTVHTNDYEKHLGAVTSHNNKPISFFSNRLRNPQRNRTTSPRRKLSW